jgi:prepilin-type N-terminal cleavage/methylation domain-containing protein
MVKRCIQSGFTLIELMVTVALGILLLSLAVPAYTASVAEHRELDMVAALKSDLEWARNEALSRNTTVAMTMVGCLWSFTDGGIAVSNHTAPTTDTSVACALAGAAPSFSGMGLNVSGTSVVVINSTNTARTYTLTVLPSGDLSVVAG